MRSQAKVIVITLLLVCAVLGSVWILKDQTFAVLDPKGIIAEKQRNLLVFTVLLSMVVIIPVFVMASVIAWRYREGNKQATYSPEWDHNKKLETIWWGIPILIIALLSVITWFSSHDLDPYKPLDSKTEPLNVQVVALQWKWLFIYPEHGIATVNYVQFPEDTPVNFTITSDAPMNSFWIPQLGGQVYAMNGMSTKLHLMADEQGRYSGSSANISGEGFADMKFVAEATTHETFSTWMRTVKDSSNPLTLQSYNILSKPSIESTPLTYSNSEHNLYDTIIMKHMGNMTEPEISEQTTNSPTNNTDGYMMETEHGN